MVISLFYGCTKDSNHNLFSNKGNSPITLRNGITMPTVVSGMLQFATKSDLNDYFDYLMTLSDEQEDSIEQSLGYTSLRTIYNQIEDNEGDIKEDLGFEIGNPFLTAVLNEYYEFAVEGTIYKYISDNVFTKGSTGEMSKFIGMRNTDKITDTGLTVIDDSRNEEIFLEPRSDCSFEIIKSKWNSNENPLIIKVMGVDPDGNSLAGDCGVRFTVNWGDGHSDTYLQNIGYWMSHYYNVPPGNCNNYTVTITINTLFCGACGNVPKTYTISRTFSVCSTVTCAPDEGEDDWIAGTYIYNNGKNRAIFYMGYDLDDYFWHDARVYGKIKNYRKKSNGKWKRSKPNHNLYIKIHGKWFINSCTGPAESVNPDPYIKRKSRIKFTYKHDDNDMGLRSDDQLFCDFKVFHSSSSNPDVILLNEPYWGD